MATYVHRVGSFVMSCSDHPSHATLARAIQNYMRWRDTHARHPDILAAQRCERARIRPQRQRR